jgi:8-oxo-dGTP pyrophosphatase MutT (NUDIX family)
LSKKWPKDKKVSGSGALSIVFLDDVDRVQSSILEPTDMKTSHDSEIPTPGQQVITACAFLHRPGPQGPEVFLPRRAASKKFLPSVFELPGGHIDFGEDLVSGLKREIFEEFAIEISVGSPFAAFTYTNEIKGSHSVEIVYFAHQVDQKAEPQLHPEDHSEFVWVSEPDLSEVYSDQKSTDDHEFEVIREGFRLLKHGNLRFH